MNKKLLYIVVVLLAIAAGSAGYVRLKPSVAPEAGAPGAQAVIYQCPMHPEVTLDRPGKCSICGMKLTPITKPEAVAP